ncbi:acetamidase/formamidase family protein [Streptococcus hyovaginalis]|uniref:acetamidase/formamidase family protein n=1 Tax=Streptococcus hyovaginalis TaxID=149015 RepID=UPI002A803709|nr:acetamidase/formamidase family protein [Streptococcus hyovaginalis]MDY4510140.1 acetamidase/formamidase family protein [Streptococcus hyovaginalis]
MTTLHTDTVIFAMSKENKPVARAKSGDRVTFETLDCFSNTIKSESDVVSQIDMDHVNPATGPLFIEGALPGDTLKVTIHKITLEERGAVIASPGFGQFANEVTAEETVICQVARETVSYKGLTLPLRKMIGVIGTAPSGDAVNTGTPDDHGGNMDTTAITEGSILYLPVNTEGALLAMGDVHATMGDGEIMGSGLEIPAVIDVTVDVLKECSYPLPLVEIEDKWITIGSRPSMEEATKLALDHMSQLIQDLSDLDFNQAGMLLSLAGDVVASQLVNPNVTMRVELPKAIFEK